MLAKSESMWEIELVIQRDWEEELDIHLNVQNEYVVQERHRDYWEELLAEVKIELLFQGMEHLGNKLISLFIVIPERQVFKMLYISTLSFNLDVSMLFYHKIMTLALAEHGACSIAYKFENQLTDQW